MKLLKSTALLLGLTTTCLSSESYGMDQHRYDCPTQFQWKMVGSQPIHGRQWYHWEAPVGQEWRGVSGFGKIYMDTASNQWPVLENAATDVQGPWHGDRGVSLFCSYHFSGHQAVIKQIVPYAHCTAHDNPAHDPKRKPYFLCH